MLPNDSFVASESDTALGHLSTLASLWILTIGRKWTDFLTKAGLVISALINKRTEFTKLHSTYWSHCPYDQQPDGCIEETNPTRLWKFDDVHQLIVHQVSLGGGEPGESASVHQSSRSSGPCLEHSLAHHCDTVYLFRWLLVYLRRTQINFGSSKYPSPSLLSLIGSLLPYCN